jgi:hypothetical protein
LNSGVYRRFAMPFFLAIFCIPFIPKIIKHLVYVESGQDQSNFA